MYLDDKLTKEAYDDKYSELSKKLDNERKREQYSPTVHYHRKTLQIR